MHFYLRGAPLLGIILLASFSATQNSLAETGAEYAHRIMCTARLLEDLGKLDKNGIRNLDVMEAYPPYLEFAGAGYSLRPESEKRAIRERYLEKFYSRYGTGDFERLETESLDRSLRAHGMKGFGRIGRPELEAQSHENLRTYLAELVGDNSRDDRIENLVSAIDFFAVHNGSMRDTPEAAILSSFELESLTGHGGVWSTSPFAKSFMQQDRNVFFRLSFGEVTPSGSEYGMNGVILDPRYAEEHAWVSSYIMYSDHLTAAGRRVGLVDESSVISQYFDAQWKEHVVNTRSPERPTYLETEGKAAPLGEPARKIRDQLFRLDFTVADFRSLIRAIVRTSLVREKAERPEKFATLVARTRDNPQAINREVANIIPKVFGIYEFELKVPLLVPREKLKLVR